MQAKDRKLAEVEEKLIQQEKIYYNKMILLQVTEKDELVQTKEMELARARQQLQSTEARVADLSDSVESLEAAISSLPAKRSKLQVIIEQHVYLKNVICPYFTRLDNITAAFVKNYICVSERVLLYRVYINYNNWL